MGQGNHPVGEVTGDEALITLLTRADFADYLTSLRDDGIVVVVLWSTHI